MIKPRGGEGSVLHPALLFTPTCRHGTFEVFVKRGIWQPARFCHSQLLLSGMTMLAAGCTVLREHRQPGFFNYPSID